MINEIIGGCYKILAQIGEGGMGEVFRGIDLNLDREVAIKVIRPELAIKPEILQRFRKEAVVLARLNHPNIATLYNFLHEGQSYFMVMEYAPGQTLDRVIANNVGGLPWRCALELFMDALRALEHAHAQGIIHRDIKPANMMVSDRDTLKVLDFGIARVLGQSRVTRTGVVVGTTKYMAPEQIAGRGIDARSDIYSLGIVLYEMLTGRVPFEGLGEYDLMRAQIGEPPRPVRELIANIPEAVEDALMRAIEKDPDRRFQTTSEFMGTIVPHLREHAGESISGGGLLPNTGPGGRAPRRAGLLRRHSAATEGNLARQPVELSTASGPMAIPGEPCMDQPAPQLAVVRSSVERSATKSPAEARPPTVEPPVRPAPGGGAGRHGPRWILKIWKKRVAGVAVGVSFIVAIIVIVDRMVLPLFEAPDPEVIATLVQRARNSLAADRVSGPGDDTALAHAQKALDLAPADAGARQVMSAVIAHLLNAGQLALKNGAIADANAKLSAAERLMDEYKLEDSRAPELAAAIQDQEARRAASAQREQRIGELLAEARAAFEAGKLAEAAALAQKVLALAADNPEARQLIEDAGEGVFNWVKDALTRGDVAAAREKEDDVLSMVQKYGLSDVRLNELRDWIAREEQRQKQERERLAMEKDGGADRLASVARLLDKARTAAAADRWTAPENDNAVEYAQQVLDLDPKNAAALGIIGSAVVIATVNDGDAALKAGDTTTAMGLRDVAKNFAAKYGGADQAIEGLSGRIVEAERDERERNEQDGQRAAREARIMQLIASGDRALSEDRLMTPADDNAMQHARDLKALDPRHPGARRLVSAVIDRYVLLAEAGVAKEDFEKARESHATANRIAAEFGLQDEVLRALAEYTTAAERQKPARAYSRRATTAEEVIARAQQAGLDQGRDSPERVRAAQDAEGAKAVEETAAQEDVTRTRAALEKAKRGKAEREKARGIGREQQLAGLRQKSRFALAAAGLTDPEAPVEKARQMLAQVDARSEATRFLHDIVVRYVARGELAAADGDLEEANGYYRVAERLVREYRLADSEVRKLERRLEDRRMENESAQRERELEEPKQEMDSRR